MEVKIKRALEEIFWSILSVVFGVCICALLIQVSGCQSTENQPRPDDNSWTNKLENP